VVIDEQHRFGVEQRAKLHAKGDTPDLLVMTATPIPRTLALTLYGDLDISTIKTLPPGRKPIRTVWRTADVREKVFQYLIGEVQKGGQAYLVYPLIEADEESDLLSLQEDHEHLIGTAFKGLPVGLVHGRIKPAERDETLRKFRDGEISILMATTVIEVGIDNPNANFLVIEHAERFGLAQLHQLRGRVGRGEKGGTVVAIAHPPVSDMARKRLNYFQEHSNGFEVAEADLELRGPGELFGQRQSGIPELRMARLSSDLDLLEAARRLCERLIHEEPALSPDERKLSAHLADKTSSQTLAVAGG
jgi:ATP-dependent DNA helicase RecG